MALFLLILRIGALLSVAFLFWLLWRKGQTERSYRKILGVASFLLVAMIVFLLWLGLSGAQS